MQNQYEETVRQPAALVKPAVVANYLGQSQGALAQDRYRGKGPAFIRDGRRVMYRWQDVEDYIQTRVTIPGDSAGPAVKS